MGKIELMIYQKLRRVRYYSPRKYYGICAGVGFIIGFSGFYLLLGLVRVIQ